MSGEMQKGLRRRTGRLTWFRLLAGLCCFLVLCQLKRGHLLVLWVEHKTHLSVLERVPLWILPVVVMHPLGEGGVLPCKSDGGARRTF